MNIGFYKFCELERELSHYNRCRFAQNYNLEYERLSDDGVAVAGVDGWLFIANGSNSWEGQFTGALHLTDSGLSDWQNAFERRQQTSELINAAFVHLVVPEKQSVLTSARWVDGVTIHAHRPILQIQSRLIDKGSLLVYPAHSMASESYYAELYFRGDSHCCVSGTWLYFLEIARRVWSEKIFDFSLVPLERSWRKQDLMEKFSKNVYEEIIKISRNAKVLYNNELARLTGAQVGNHYLLHNPEAPFLETVVIYGDSYSFDMGFSDLVSVFFVKVHFIWGTVIDFNYCKKNDANYIIVQSAERFLARVHTHDHIGLR
jgi:hypothetical protein